MSSEPHPQHQQYREAVLNSTRPSMTTEQRILAKHKFYRIMDRFSKEKRSNAKYNRHLLIRYTYEYAVSEESQDRFLQTFFQALTLSIDGQGRIDLNDKVAAEELWSNVSSFADYLVDNFFLPLKTAAKRPPLPPLASQPALPDPDPTTDVREDCLTRDGYRCVITQAFDYNEALLRHKKYGENARDDEGNLLFIGGNQFYHLEAAPILPHSLTQTGSGSSELSQAKKIVLAILNMFDNGILELINDHVLDQSRNAITLTKNFHHMFGEFEFYFTLLDGPNDKPHTYEVASFVPSSMRKVLPITRTLFPAENQAIEPPEPRFLAVRRAIAHVLHLSSAGQYIDGLLQNFNEKRVEEDGSTELGLFAQLRLDGWCGGGAVERH
ncbi:hypothetical protein ACHAQJ_003447 [Trichoderma viride]